VNSTDRLTVLTYHAVDDRSSVISVTPEVFRHQATSLAERRLRGMSLAQAFAEREQNGAFPPDAIAITFDDGYLSVMENARPVLSEHGFTATVFLASALVGLSADAARAANPDLDRAMLDWDQARKLLQAGWEIGSHSVSHPDLTRLDRVACEHELAESKRQLEQRLQQPVRSLAYPYGRLNPAVRDLAAGHYELACTTRLAVHRGGADPLRIDRIDMYYMQNARRFGKLLDGKLEPWLKTRRALRAVRAKLESR
jgi:peptidoglycan/xylan/chitin deacetylase (PgdA/CDA1 family)